MDTLETKRLEMFRRVRELGPEHAAQFPADSYGGGLFVSLDTVIKGLEEHALRQSTGQSTVREGTSSKAAVRDELWRRLEAISRTARVIAFTSPGLEDKFRLPRGIGDEALLQLARTFASDAAPLKDEFIRRGLAATFIEDLNEEAEAFEAAITRKAQGRSAHVSASAEIDDLIERGMRTVRELDALFRNTFADDPATLAAWQSASHVERRVPRHAKAKSPADSAPPSSQ
ncbi:MAG: hypothetical protein DMF67_17985 [Acidobacteria bacterium]|nr:MAG: hypothetical protein DMF67_17985 [Acidobacteriota bacterium]